MLNLKQLTPLVFCFRPEADVLPQRSRTALETGSRLLKGCRAIHSCESYHTNLLCWAVQFFSKSMALPTVFPVHLIIPIAGQNLAHHVFTGYMLLPRQEQSDWLRGLQFYPRRT